MEKGKPKKAKKLKRKLEKLGEEADELCALLEWTLQDYGHVQARVQDWDLRFGVGEKPKARPGKLP